VALGAVEHPNGLVLGLPDRGGVPIGHFDM
jgi:hypothetical protein